MADHQPDPPLTAKPAGPPPGAELFPFGALRASLVAIAAVLGFPVVAGFVAVAAPYLAGLQHRAPLPLAANHLVTLGWGTLIAIGALHQLLPAAAGVRRDLSPLVPVQLPIHLCGVALLAAGFASGWHPVTVAGGSGVAASALAMLGMAIGLVRRRGRALSVLRYVVAALVCLAATVLWGLALAINRWLALWPTLLRPAGLGIHLTLGLVGWFALLVVGVSYYLLPRFAGIRNPMDRQDLVFGGLACGAGLLLVGNVVPGRLVQLGLMVVGLAGLLYAWDLHTMLRAWRTRGRDIVRAHWWVLLVETSGLGAAAAAWGVGLLPGDGLRWGVAGATLFLLGWVTLAITGQAYKVTPFLMWYYRFHRGLSALEVPRLEAPYWPRIALPPLVLLAAAGPVVAAGVLAASPRLCGIGGVAYFVGAVMFAFVLGYSWIPAVWRGRRPPAAAAEAR